MRLLRAHIINAETCGGLLNGLDLRMRSPLDDTKGFQPLCLVGPNGTGKSQFLQVLAEAFQCVFHACAPEQERSFKNTSLQFEIEYLIHRDCSQSPLHVRISHKAPSEKRRPVVSVQTKQEQEWVDCALTDPQTRNLLPLKIVGYTSGGNETLSMPFLVSRSGYAKDVRERAFKKKSEEGGIPDTRLMLIDYGTHFEVLAANLLLGTPDQRTAVLHEARLRDVHSFRCVIKLDLPDGKEIQLTEELRRYIEHLRRCATCYSHDDKNDEHTFDFLVDSETRKAFKHFWDDTLHLYSSFHKFAMLNDLAIPKGARERYERETEAGHFAPRLPEPQDEHKVFKFGQLAFITEAGERAVDYVSLSDGEHQLAQILGTFCMLSHPNVLFLLDEPESHFNPQWRVKFISKLLDLPTKNGTRENGSAVSRQDCLLTTHAPFVPSDMSRERVLIFGKNAESGEVKVKRPDIETYGTTFDAILEECFGIRPPISEVPKREIDHLLQSDDRDEIKSGIKRLGYSTEKVILADRLRQLPEETD